jgi:hypothetical protein
MDTCAYEKPKDRRKLFIQGWQDFSGENPCPVCGKSQGVELLTFPDHWESESEFIRACLLELYLNDEFWLGLKARGIPMSCRLVRSCFRIADGATRFHLTRGRIKTKKSRPHGRVPGLFRELAEKRRKGKPWMT